MAFVSTKLRLYSFSPLASRLSPLASRLSPLASRLSPLALSAALIFGSASAAPVNWVPNADGFWDVATNWSSNPALPGAADNVTIDVGGATVRTITHQSGTDTINSLTSQENIALTGGTLNLNAASMINGSYTQSGGILGGTGNLTVTGAATLSGGVMTDAGRTILQGATALTALSLDALRVLENRGAVTWSAGELDLNATGAAGVGQIENALGGVFEATGDNTLSSTAKAVGGDGDGASFTNAGTFGRVRNFVCEQCVEIQSVITKRSPNWIAS